MQRLIISYAKSISKLESGNISYTPVHYDASTLDTVFSAKCFITGYKCSYVMLNIFLTTPPVNIFWSSANEIKLRLQLK